MNLEKILITAFLVPRGEPSSPHCRWGLPVLLWGAPGIGKSDRIRAASTAVGLPYEVLYAATKQPEDAGSVLVPDGKGGATSICALPQVRRIMQEPGGTLFIDELSCASPAVQAAFLSLILEGNIGDADLPPRIRMVAAANPVEDAAGGWELEPPMANRLLHFAVPVPTVDAWIDWLFDGNSNNIEKIEDGERRVAEAWPDVFPRAKALISGFLKTRGAMLHSLPKEGDPSRSRAWCSPRTWEFAVRAYATCLALGHADLCTSFISACVGEGAAIAFTAWLKDADLPDPQDVILKGWTPDKKRLDRSLSVYRGMAAHISDRRTLEERLPLGVGAWSRVKEAQAAGLSDIVMKPANALVQAGLGRKASPEIGAVAIDALADFAKTGHAQYIKGA